MGIDLNAEAKGQLVKVADGFWVMATGHHPGGSHKFPEINNRCLVFQLQDGEETVLAVVNGTGPETIPQVKAVEAETGLVVRYVISPGGGHHLFMGAWHDAFEQAKVLLCPVRTPRTANGEKLLKLARVELMDADAPLPQFSGQLEAVLFCGLLSLPDMQSPAEGGKDSMWNMMKAMWKMMTGGMKDPVDELWLFHVETGTLIGGENLGWMYTDEDKATLPGMMKGMVKEGVHVQAQARKVGDKSVVASCWEKILSWPAKTVISYHDTPGHAFVGDGTAALKAAIADVKQLPS